MNRRVFTQFEIPRAHLSQEGPHYKLPEAHSRSQIVSQELNGTLVTRAAIAELQRRDVDDGGYTARLLAGAALNSAWYTYATTDDTMRRVVKMPMLVSAEDTERATRSSLLNTASDGFEAVSNLERRAVVILENGVNMPNRLRRSLGKALGHSSLSLACLDAVDGISVMDRAGAQARAREACQNVLEKSHDAAYVMGAYPSLAQVGLEASELMLYVRRRAPRAVNGLLDSAIEAVELESGLTES